MLKRQRETVMLSSSSLSSSRRQNLQQQQQHQNHDHSVKPIGCLSGILHLVSKQQRHRRRRFLTFGKKQGKYRDVEVPTNSSSPSEKADNKVISGGNQIGVSSSSSTRTTTLQVDQKKEDRKKEDGGGEKIRHARSLSCQEDGGGDKIRHARSLSCQLPRSPTLSVEIRQSDSVLSPDNFSEPTFKDGRSTTSTNSSTSTLVGVDEKETACSSAEEKRRMLLGALEKCDEDLKAIKNIIEALQTSPRMERQRGTNGDKFEAYGNVKEFKQSPIYVLPHDFLSPPATLNSTSCFSKRHITYGQTMQQQKPQPRKKNPRQEHTITSTSFFHRVTTIGVSVPIKREIAAWSSKAIGESVVEVCNDVDCGERREVMRIGLVLQDFVLKDLLDQVVKELLLLGRAKTSTCLYSSLPFEACKKKLRF